MLNLKKFFFIKEEQNKIILRLGVKFVFGKNTHKFLIKLRYPFLKFKKTKEFKKLLKQYKNPNINITNSKIKKIYVLGDSHTNFFSGEEFIRFIKYKNGINKVYPLINCFKPYHLGSTLAYNIANPNSSTQGLKRVNWLLKNKIPKESILILCFGEIDIRCHVIKQSKVQNKTTEEIIDNIINNYAKFIKYLQEKDYKIITWAPIASPKDIWTDNPDYPKIGTEDERNYATKIFNEKLEQLSKEHNFINCSIFPKIIDKDNKTIEKYIADECHLSQKALPLMVEEFSNKGLLNIHKNKIIINFKLPTE